MNRLDTRIEAGINHPYDNKKRAEPSWQEAAALAVLYDLSDRRGIKQELACVDLDVRGEIVETLSELILAASKTKT